MIVLCDLWWPTEWSRAHPRDAVPFHGWLAWHYANLLPKGDA